MALIQIKSEWNEVTQKSVPTEYSIIGEGPIIIADALMIDAEPSLAHIEIVFGPYRLRVVGRSFPDVYICELMSDV